MFGPIPRDYDQQVPKKMKALALRSALSDRAREGKLLVVEDLDFAEAPKTKRARKALEAWDVQGKVLLVLQGTEVKSLRMGRASIGDGFVDIDERTSGLQKGDLITALDGNRLFRGIGGGRFEDVTARVNGAVKPGSSDADAFTARRGEISKIEDESTKATGLRSDVVTLYQGGQ